ncbi:Uncharacterised protein [Legionella wadsworthii]|uniref:Uncharacterized protein n=1 Tax=Legionella wadsworthii TaxID=28088 RepID=A0A378LVC7_9GAMM|nr:Uncharacterised protein [Legionella wadsworthii]
MRLAKSKENSRKQRHSACIAWTTFCEDMNKPSSILITIIFQLCIALICFTGFILDPLIGVIVVLIYFLFIGTLLTYFFLLKFRT